MMRLIHMMNRSILQVWYISCIFQLYIILITYVQVIAFPQTLLIAVRWSSGDEIWKVSEAEFSNDFDGPNIVCNDNTSTSLASSNIPIDDDDPED